MLHERCNPGGYRRLFVAAVMVMSVMLGSDNESNGGDSNTVGPREDLRADGATSGWDAPEPSSTQGEPDALKLCCECICVPHYPDPWCYYGDCVWVPVDEMCPAPYGDPEDCPTDDIPGIPSYLERGDILFCECQDPSFHHIPGWDHAAIYVGDGDFVEAVPELGVRRVGLAAFYEWGQDITYGHVHTASGADKDSAAEFAEGQIGKPYQYLPFAKDPSEDAEAWYCSELVWGAYYSVGIDVDQNGWDYPHVVEPFEISLDEDVLPFVNEPPSTPERPQGNDYVYRLETRRYRSVTTDPDGDDLFYRWSWGESSSDWSLLPRQESVTFGSLHMWITLGTHPVRVRAMDIWGVPSDWSDPLMVTVRRIFGDGSSLEATSLQMVQAAPLESSAVPGAVATTASGEESSRQSRRSDVEGVGDPTETAVERPGILAH